MTRYSDDSDRTTSLEESERAFRISEVSRAAESSKLKYVGVCYSCDEPLHQPKIFCDKSCADQYEQDAAARRRNGRPS